MKIDAEVELGASKGKDVGESFVRVPVDIDYVDGNADSVKEWVRNALEEKYGGAFGDEDFTVANLDDIVEDIEFDEFVQDVVTTQKEKPAGENVGASRA